jgi:hypothetical protein
MSYGEDILERYLKLMVPHSFNRNFRPEWLLGLELDFYFHKQMVGIEFQGDHHYLPTEYCQDHQQVKTNDRCKVSLCSARGIRILKLDAVDLQYARLRGKFKRIGNGFSSKIMLHDNIDLLRRLNKESNQYRKTLRKMGAVNCYHTWSSIRKNKVHGDPC